MSSLDVALIKNKGFDNVTIYLEEPLCSRNLTLDDIKDAIINTDETHLT
jgi:hypothetical protein